MFDLADENWIGSIINLVIKNKIDLVVIDSVRTCFLSLDDENSKVSWLLGHCGYIYLLDDFRPFAFTS